MKRYVLISLALILGVQSFLAQEKKLIIQGDDMGFSHAANMACIEAYQQGILTVVDVIVPGPWFSEAARLINENPGLDVGVHLVLISEWNGMKWRPLTHAPSLVTSDGYFPVSNEAMLALDKNPDEIEAEFRAQIELAISKIPQVSHMNIHAYNNADPVINTIATELATEYDLILGFSSMTRFGMFWSDAPENKESVLANFIRQLPVGTSVFIGHPAYDTEETRALQVEGSSFDANLNMSLYRQAATEAFLSNDIMQLPIENNVVLTNYVNGIKEIPLPTTVAEIGEGIVEVWPNPFDDTVSIRLNPGSPVYVTLKMLRTDGSIIQEICNDHLVTDEIIFTWNREYLPAGTYYCHIQIADSVKVISVVKQ